MLKLYNTLHHELEEFKPIKDREIGIYSCGPTVYWNQHIGHMYAYVQYDSMVRFFRFLGYKVNWIMNITDVGHLTSDADTGDDKMEKGAQREGLTVWQIADKYLAQFKESLTLLNIQTPDVLCRATEHIGDQIQLIQKMEANGFTYKTKTGLVFDTSKFPNYADFAQLRLTSQESGSRVEIDPEKKNPWDFLLWVTNQPNHLMQWDSPWGKGFPGWHIECTAMSTKYLGEKFDIHTGGKEHIPVHHTNEIAQGYGAFGHQTANYWLHNEWLTVKGEKMSKSLGNFYTITDLMKKNYDPLSFRYLVLNSQYRSGMDFTFEALTAAQNAYIKLKNLVINWQEVKEKSSFTRESEEKTIEIRQKFIEAISNNLNFPEGIAILWEMAKSSMNGADKLDLVMEFNQVLGLDLEKVSKGEKVSKVTKEIEVLANKREQLRKENKWDEADKIREEIEKHGYQIKDTPEGYKLTVKI